MISYSYCAIWRLLDQAFTAARRRLGRDRSSAALMKVQAPLR